VGKTNTKYSKYYFRQMDAMDITLIINDYQPPRSPFRGDPGL
jgi:hypothetical protein